MVSRSLCEEIPKITSNLSILDAPLKPKRVVIFGSVHAVMSVIMLFLLMFTGVDGRVEKYRLFAVLFQYKIETSLT